MSKQEHTGKASLTIKIIGLILIAGIIGFVIYTLVQKKQIADTLTTTNMVVKKASTILDTHLNTLLKKAKNHSVYSSTDIPRSTPSIQTMVYNHKTNQLLSFGEQSLINKAKTRQQLFAEIVLAGQNTNSAFLNNSKYVFATAKALDNQSVILTRQPINKVTEQLKAETPAYISLVLSPIKENTENTENAILTTALKKKYIGASQSITMGNLAFSSSYDLPKTIFSPLIIGIASGLGFFLLGLPVLLLIRRQTVELDETVDDISINEFSNQHYASKDADKDNQNRKTADKSIDAKKVKNDVQNTQNSDLDADNDELDSFDELDDFDTRGLDNLDGLNDDLLNDDLDDLEGEIKSKEEEVAKYRQPSVNQSHQSLSSQPQTQSQQQPQTQSQLQNQPQSQPKNQPQTQPTIAFTTSNQPITSAKDPKTQLADAELDVSNALAFDGSGMGDASDNQKALTDEQLTAFRKHDIRCDAQFLDDNFIERFAMAFYEAMLKQKQHSLVIGHDIRPTSQAIASKLAQALAQRGLFVTQIGAVTTPLMAFAARKTCDNGLMITASHNDMSDNGIKWLINNISPSEKVVQDFKAKMMAYDADDLANNKAIDDSDLQTESFNTLYKNSLVQDIMLANHPTICIDCMYGATSILAPSIFEEVGCMVIPFNYDIDGQYEGSLNPSEPKRLQFLAEKVLAHEADLGIAFDGDGDRLAVVDNKGRVVDADKLIALFAKFLLETNQTEHVIYDVKCSRFVADTIVHAGGVPQMLPTGSSHMRNGINQGQLAAVFAGEFSGHFMFNDNRLPCYDDGVYSALRLLEWMTQTNVSLSVLVDTLPEVVASADIYIKMPSTKQAQLFMLKLKTEWNNVSSIDTDIAHQFVLNDTDGVRLDHAEGFGLVRSSSTNLAITVRFSASDEASFDQIKALFVKLTLGVDAKIANQIKSITYE